METTPSGPAAATPLLQVQGVTLAFGGVKALTGVGFDVQPGSITAVIGPNGAGKTSLFNTISGFYRPSQGSIRFQGQDITRVPAPQRAKLGLGRSFQNIALFRGMTVLDNIKLGRHAHLKTNVLDAVYFLSMCKSSLAMTDGQSVRHGSDFFLLEGEYRTDAERTEMEQKVMTSLRLAYDKIQAVPSR